MCTYSCSYPIYSYVSYIRIIFTHIYVHTYSWLIWVAGLLIVWNSWLVDWLQRWLVGGGWLAGWLVGRSVGRLVGWLVGWSVVRFLNSPGARRGLQEAENCPTNRFSARVRILTVLGLAESHRRPNAAKRRCLVG